MDYYEPPADIISDAAETASSIMDEDITRAPFESGNGKTPYLVRDISPSKKIELAIVLLEMKAALMKNEALVKNEEIRQFVRDSLKAGITDGIVYVNCPPQLASDLKSARRVLENDGKHLNTLEFTEQSSGNIIIGAAEQDSNRLAELISETYSIAKSFNVNKDILEASKTSEGTIITTKSRDLSTAQTFFMMPELSHARLKYSYDPLEDKLSILVNDAKDKAKLKDLIRKVSADISSTDFRYWEHVFDSKTKAELEISQMVKAHSLQPVYVTSSECIDGQYTFLKISPSSEVSLITGTNPMNEKEYDKKPITDLDNLRLKLASFEKPVILSEKEFLGNKEEAFKQKNTLAYGEAPRNEVDKQITDLLKCKALSKVNYRQRDLSKVWSDIKDAVSKTDDIDTIIKFEKIKDLDYEAYGTTLSRYCAAHIHLDSVFKEPEKAVEKDVPGKEAR